MSNNVTQGRGPVMNDPADESWTDAYQTRAGAVAHRATAHNHGEAVWEEQVDERAVILRMSSWPRAREAEAALVREGWTVEFLPAEANRHSLLRVAPADEHIETPAESAAIVDGNLRARGSVGLCTDKPPVDDLVGRVVDTLAAAALTYRHESDLQVVISDRLAAAGIEHVREARLGPGERIDLLTDDGVGVEVKVAGSWTTVARQLLRYARHDQVRALVLVSTQASHSRIPYELGGIAVVVHLLIGQGV